MVEIIPLPHFLTPPFSLCAVAVSHGSIPASLLTYRHSAEADTSWTDKGRLIAKEEGDGETVPQLSLTHTQRQFLII